MIRRRGHTAERVAEQWLRDRGLEPVDRNRHVAGAELDLVMREGNTLIFIEVRHRRRDRFGDGAESISRHKRRHLLRAASAYLAREPDEVDGRFDVVAISGPLDDKHIEWIRDAFGPDDV